MSKSINPMLFLKPDTGPFPARPPCHRLDEFADGYSLTGCSPALPVSASPASHHSRVDAGNLSTVYSSLSGLSRTVKANYQYIGGPLLMIEVGQSGVSNSDDRLRRPAWHHQLLPTLQRRHPGHG